MFEASVTQWFAAAHALRGYKGKCENLHGHNYKVEVTVAGDKLDGCGLIADFVDIKSALKSAIDRLDHTNLNETPPFDEELNPSAENIAWYIWREVQAQLGEATHVASVKVWETEGCVAVYRP
ncbi:MAG: 6-carboxytetrahydropterin synthase QueD [Bryobacteraceae bacterium]